MTIIEAFQKAENGALITNGFLKGRDHFLKYMGLGVFYEYELVNGKPGFKYIVREFPISYIISIDWEIVPNEN
jgi:hypothetical protein